MTPAALASSILEAARVVMVSRGHDVSVIPAGAGLERTRDPRYGDYTSTVALRVARHTGDHPRELAGAIVTKLVPDQGSSFEVVGPGFVNVRVPPPTTDRLAQIVISQGTQYGRGRRFAGCDVEHDHALASNQRGPSDLAEMRAYLVRQALSRILVALGARVPSQESPPSSRAFDQLVAAVGPDPARYYLVRSRSRPPAPDSASLNSAALDAGTIDAIARHVPQNPVYLVRYAAARAAATVRNAADLGVEFGVNDEPGRLRHKAELALVRALGDYPWVVETAAELRMPHRVARYLEDLAMTYHDFSDLCPLLPKGDEQVSDRMRVRSRLNAATRVVFANGLHLLGIQAPMRM